MADTIATPNEIEIALGVSGDSTAAERQLIAQIHGPAEGAVKRVLQYDPVFQTHTAELYPCVPALGNDWNDHYDGWGWDVDALASPTRALMQHFGGHESRKLLTKHVPIRSVTQIRQDRNAKGGQNANDFPAASILVAGDDYYVDFDVNGIAPTGIIHRIGCSWSFELRTIQITYVAGYTADEFMGLQLIDASPIKQAVLLTASFMFNQQVNWQKKGGAGFGGPLSHERLQDYSYTRAPDGISAVVNGSIPPEAALELLAPFQRMSLQLC